MGFPRQEYWSALPFLSPYLTDPTHKCVFFTVAGSSLKPKLFSFQGYSLAISQPPLQSGVAQGLGQSLTYAWNGVSPMWPSRLSSFPNWKQRTLSPGKSSKRWDWVWTPPHVQKSHLPSRNTCLGLLHKQEIHFSCIKPLNVLRLICYSSYLLLWQIQTVSWHISLENCLAWYIAKCLWLETLWVNFTFFLLICIFNNKWVITCVIRHKGQVKMVSHRPV